MAATTPGHSATVTAPVSQSAAGTAAPSQEFLHCTVAAEVALERRARRLEENPSRRAHETSGPDDAVAHASHHHGFERVSIDAPWMEVDTTDGYDPRLETVLGFAAGT